MIHCLRDPQHNVTLCGKKNLKKEKTTRAPMFRFVIKRLRCPVCEGKLRKADKRLKVESEWSK